MVELHIHDNSPNWDDVLAEPLAAFPWLISTPGDCSFRTQRVLVGDKHIPVTVLRRPLNSFRREVTQDTDVKVLFDVVTVLPFPVPFAYVIPVINDDIQDPFYCSMLLPLLLVQEEGRCDREMAKILCAANRLLVASFCEADQRGLLLLGDQYQIVKAELFEVNEDEERIRQREILDVLELLETFDIETDTASTKALVEVFSEVFCQKIIMRDGSIVTIPRKGSISISNMSVFPIMRDHGRLSDRRSVHARKREPEPDIDIFLTHAHIDAEVVSKVGDWLGSIWPNLRISHTDPADEKTFRENPSFFLIKVRRARCILFVVSPNSLDRPMVDTEIGISADKPIICLLVGGVSLECLRKKNDTSLFLRLDMARAVDTAVPGWPLKLGVILSDVLGLGQPHITIFPNLPPVSAIGRQDIMPAYVQDCLAIALDVNGVKDRAFADDILQRGLLEKARSDGDDPERLRAILAGLPTEHKFLILLQTIRLESDWRECLRLFPVLLNDDLLAHSALLSGSIEQEQPSAVTERLVCIEAVVASEILWQTLCPLPTWAIERGVSYLEEIGLHPKLLEYFDHQQAGGCAEDFDFGFHQPNGDPPLDVVRKRIPDSRSARDWFVDGLVQRLRNAATQSSHGRLLFVTTDFHTGRLQGLAGSDWLEKQEANPDRGMRGMMRYLQPCYRAPLEWELEACRRVASDSIKLAVVLPLVRIPEELRKGIETIIEHRVKPWAVGTIPEAPSNVINARDLIASSAALVKDSGLRFLCLLDFEALATAHNLSASELEQDFGKQLIHSVITTLISEARCGAQAVGSDLEFGISRTGLYRLERSGARAACELAKQLTFIVDE